MIQRRKVEGAACILSTRLEDTSALPPEKQDIAHWFLSQISTSLDTIFFADELNEFATMTDTGLFRIVEEAIPEYFSQPLSSQHSSEIRPLTFNRSFQ